MFVVVDDPASARDILRLFARSLRRALDGMTATHTSQLRLAEDEAALGWLDTGSFNALSAAFAERANRSSGAGTVGAEVHELIRTVLDADWTSDVRRQFMLALAVDRGFSGRDDVFTEDHFREAEVIRRGPAFYDSAAVDRVPPPIGHTTASSAARRWFRTFWLDPMRTRVPLAGGLQPTRIPLRNSVAERLADALASSEMRIAIVELPIHTLSDLDARPTKPSQFSVCGRKAPSVPPAVMTRLVETLAELRVHIAVLSELALDTAEEAALVHALGARYGRYPAMVVAGRMHRPDGASFINSGVVLDGTGAVIVEHEKIEPYTHPALGTEDILPRRSTTYAYVDTPVGRLVINICRDFASDPSVLLNRALDASLLIVPTYSTALDFVSAEAAALGQRHRAVTVATNCGHRACGGDAHIGYVYVPRRGRPKTPRAGSRYAGENWVLGADRPAASTVGTVHPFRIGIDATGWPEAVALGAVPL